MNRRSQVVSLIEGLLSWCQQSSHSTVEEIMRATRRERRRSSSILSHLQYSRTTPLTLIITPIMCECHVFGFYACSKLFRLIVCSHLLSMGTQSFLFMCHHKGSWLFKLWPATPKPVRYCVLYCVPVISCVCTCN